MNKIIFYIFSPLFLLSSITALNAFDVTVTNTMANIITHQKIRLRIRLNETEQGLFHDTLRFSIDAPTIALEHWQASIQPTAIHHRSSRYPRPAYTESFFATIAISATKDALSKLELATICVASFVLTKDGKIKAETTTTPLSTALHDVCTTPTLSPIANDQTLSDTRHTPASIPAPLPTNKLLSEFSVIDGLAALWYGLIEFCLGVLRWHFLWLVYLALLLLYIVLRLNKETSTIPYLPRLSPRWNAELSRICFWLLTGLTLYYVHGWFTAAWGWFAAAVFMLSASCFYSASVGKPRTFFEKLKLLIGFICGLLVIPLVVKGLIIMHENNIFELFGK